MKLEVSAEVPYPRQQVFEVYRDKVMELLPYLPNVRGITVTSRIEEAGVVKFINRWKGGGEIPLAVRKFLSDELLEWDDHATWTQEAFTADWKIVVPTLKDAVNAWGQNRYLEQNGKTRVEIKGEFSLDAAKVKIIPRLFAGTIGPAIEKFMVSNISTNLVALSKGVERYLDAHK